MWKKRKRGNETKRKDATSGFDGAGIYILWYTRDDEEVYFFSSCLGGSGFGVGSLKVSGFLSCPGPTCSHAELGLSVSGDMEDMFHVRKETYLPPSKFLKA